MVRMSAPILSQSSAPSFTGRIEVDIITEDLPAGGGQQQAILGKLSLNVCIIGHIQFVEGVMSIITASIPMGRDGISRPIGEHI